MKNLIPFFAFISFLIIGNRAYSQSQEENLQEVVKLYNEIKIFNKTLEESRNDEILKGIDDKVNTALDLTKKVLVSGNDMQIKAVQHFITLTVYESAKAGEIMGYDDLAFMKLIALDKYMNGILSDVFPIEYRYSGQENTITIADFLPIQTEYFETLGNVAYRAEKYKEADHYLRLYVWNDLATVESSFFAYNLLVEIKQIQDDLISDEKYARYAYLLIKNYYMLDDDIKKIVIENKDIHTVKECMEILIREGLKPDRTKNEFGFIAQGTAIAAQHYKWNEDVLELYEICYKNYYQNAQFGLIYAFNENLESYKFSKDAEAYARTMQRDDPTKAEYVGKSATLRMSNNPYDSTFKQDDCDKLEEIANNFKYWNEPTQELEFRNRLEDCKQNNSKSKRKK